MEEQDVIGFEADDGELLAICSIVHLEKFIKFIYLSINSYLKQLIGSYISDLQKLHIFALLFLIPSPKLFDIFHQNLLDS